MAEQAALQAAIGALEDPLLHRSLDSLGMVREVAVGRVGSGAGSVSSA